jgi:4-diphosphocytidyl-2-C-methyl-D-erythritol kinase
MGKDPDGIHIHITKRIPSEAGLGGGSADAAAVLRALNRHYGDPLSILALAELGAQVGSDVPFCVVGGTVMCEGRGERLRKLPDMPDCVFVVVKPEFSSSTPELYRKIDERSIAKRPDNQAMESALLAGDLSKVAQNLCNVFDPVVTEDHLELNYLKSLFYNYGAIGYQMTGSGSAVFGIVSEFEIAAVICDMVRGNYPQVFIAKPV